MTLRDRDAFLWDMLQAARNIENFIGGTSLEDYMSNTCFGVPSKGNSSSSEKPPANALAGSRSSRRRFETLNGSLRFVTDWSTDTPLFQMMLCGPSPTTSCPA